MDLTISTQHDNNLLEKSFWMKQLVSITTHSCSNTWTHSNITTYERKRNLLTFNEKQCDNQCWMQLLLHFLLWVCNAYNLIATRTNCLMRCQAQLSNLNNQYTQRLFTLFKYPPLNGQSMPFSQINRFRWILIGLFFSLNFR